MENSNLKKDIIVSVLIFLVALVLRLPYFDRPPSMMVDEGAYVTWVNFTKQGIPFFEQHPPFYWLSLSSLTPSFSYDPRLSDFRTVANDFYDFPYKTGRLFSVLLGSLLPVIIFLLMRLLYFDRRLAVLPAVFIIFDNALVLYSRAILPDILFLTLGFAGVLFAILSSRVARLKSSCLLAILAGFLVGLAFSVKWIGLGFLAAVFIFFALKRNWKNVLISGAAALFIYVFVFYSYLSIFDRGFVDAGRGLYQSEEIARLYSPGADKPFEVLKLVWDYNVQIWNTNAHRADFGQTAEADSPFYWPTGYSLMRYWDHIGELTVIKLHGNYLTWTISFISVVSLLYLLIKKKINDVWLKRVSLFLVSAYTINYLPFFFIERDMRLYHYFAAAIFSFMAFPLFLREVGRGWSEKTKSAVLYAIYVLVITLFIWLSPTTYGFLL